MCYSKLIPGQFRTHLHQCVPGISLEVHIPGNKKIAAQQQKTPIDKYKTHSQQYKTLLFQWMEASDIVNLKVCCSSDSEGEETRREISERKGTLLVHKVTVAILCSSNWLAANNVVKIEEKSYKSDHRILPRGERRIFDHARALQRIMANCLVPYAGASVNNVWGWYLWAKGMRSL